MNTPNGKMILCKQSEVDESHYLDHASGVVRGVNHITRECIEGDERAHAPGPLEEQRAEVQKAMEGYIANQYGSDTCVCGVFENAAGGLVVVVSAVKLNLRNYWGGNWRSTFSVNLGDKTISGDVKIRIHYFEDGNVQMVTDKEVSLTPFGGDGAAGAVDAIAKEETAIQDSLEQMYINMAQETFKDMRRILPISKQKMDWTGAQSMLARGFQQ